MASKKEKALGSGLGALFGSEQPLAPEKLPISKVEPRSGQPRTRFDEPALQELADSIAQHGLLQPITVRKLDSGYYQIIAGERRWRAARLAGLKEVPVRIVEADDRKAQELALVENLQREDLNPMEEARGFKALMEDFGLTQEAVSQSVGKSRPAVANSLRLLTLQQPIADMLEKGELTTGHARALLSVEPAALQLQAAKQVVEKASPSGRRRPWQRHSCGSPRPESPAATWITPPMWARSWARRWAGRYISWTAERRAASSWNTMAPTTGRPCCRRCSH